MLVLTRKAGQRILVGGDVVVTIRKISGDKVSVSIEAPRDLRILRGEILDKESEAKK